MADNVDFAFLCVWGQGFSLDAPEVLVFTLSLKVKWNLQRPFGGDERGLF